MFGYLPQGDECGKLNSNVKFRDELYPLYSSGVHYKWMIYFIVMPLGSRQKKYLVLAREDLTNQVEGHAL